jgi:hypothetical protein
VSHSPPAKRGVNTSAWSPFFLFLDSADPKRRPMRLFSLRLGSAAEGRWPSVRGLVSCKALPGKPRWRGETTSACFL